MNWRNLFTLPAALLSAGATLLCPERGQASTGQSPQNVHVMLEVSHGSGSGAYAPSSTVSISANSPSDNSVFLGWIKLSECDGQITDANSQSTTFGCSNVSVGCFSVELGHPHEKEAGLAKARAFPFMGVC